MKKVLLLATVGIFSLGTFASNGSKIEEKLDFKEAADFPVYCDGVYAGNASTISEAIALCD